MFGLKLLQESEYKDLKEAITTYQRTLEDVGWISMSMDTDMSIEKICSVDGIAKMIKRVKFYYITNPLAGQWVNLTTNFIFGEGLSKPRAKDPKIQEVVDKFWDDPDNQLSLTSLQAQQGIGNKLQYEGNLFFMLFDDDKGDVRVRLLNTEEISDIIKSGNDRNRTNFYKVQDRRKKYNYISDSWEMLTSEYVYYPDLNIFDENAHGIPRDKLKTGVKILHIKVNGDLNDKFGFPDLYRGIAWQKAHKAILGDVATLTKALSKFAWKKKVKGSPAKVNSLKTALATKTSLNNIANSAGQTQIENEGIDLQSIKIDTGGIKIGVDSARQMVLMNCAASGIPEHYFGNPDSGNLATTKSMELPVLKKFSAYQALWQGIYNEILQYQVNKKIEVGLLPGIVKVDKKAERLIHETKLDRTIDVDFPPILESDLKNIGEALQVGKANKLISKETAAQVFLNSANINNVEEEIAKIDFDEQAKQEINNNMLIPGQEKEVEKEDPKKTDNKKEEKKPIKESIVMPSRSPADKLAGKNKFVLQRMNGYRKSLAGNFRKLQEDIKNNIVHSGDKGYIVGNVGNLETILSTFAQRMKESAEEYFPIAIDIGKNYFQSHLPKKKIYETLFEAEGRQYGLLNEKLTWNAHYVDTSLIPAIKNKLEDNIKDYYDTEAKLRTSISESVTTFESRIEQYSGAFWHVEEAAVKEAGKGTDVMVNFVGADDSGTCEGCNDAMDNNPHPIDTAPEPGSHECNGRCRHALQIITNTEG